jgi:hypothetical protein
MWWTIGIGLFLLAHGLIHVAIYAPPTAADAPFDSGHSWLSRGARQARPLLLTFAYGSAAALMVAGIGLFAKQDWWQVVAIVGAALSLLLLVLFFNPWITIGVAINVAVIFVLVQTDWPSAGTLGW